MVLAFKAGVFITLGIIAYFDFKERQFPWWAIALCFSCIVSLGIMQLEIQTFFKASLLNMAFVLVQLLLLMFWFLIKQRRLINIVDTYLGLGDILFFLTTCFAFSFFNFIFYHFISLVITLVVALLMIKKSENKKQGIPVAGILSVILALFMLIGATEELNFYNDSWITEWM